MRKVLVFLAFIAACDAAPQKKETPAPVATVSVAVSAAAPAPPAPKPRDPRKHAVRLPQGHDPKRPAPLVVALHGFGGWGSELANKWLLNGLADRKGFLLAIPDGTKNKKGERFWNGTDACCAFDGPEVDDVAYVSQIIDDVQAEHAVDPRRIYVVGYSNGGFLAHRVACELSSRVAAVVSLAGATWKDESRCAPSERVSVLQIHGDKDQIIKPAGGRANGGAGPEYPPVSDTVAAWGKKNGCTGKRAEKARLDIDLKLPGKETRVERFEACPRGGDVESWTVEGGTHFLDLAPAFGDAVWQFLSAHSKTGPRPFELEVPSRYDASKPAPLLIALHGLGGDGAQVASAFRLTALAEQRGILLAMPDGTRDAKGRRFWNATGACCNFDGAPVDDVAYLGSVIDDVMASHAVDTKRVFVVGHSNGGFMAYRLACEMPSRIAAVVSVAGAGVEACAGGAPVSVLQIHGTKDKTVTMEGGRLFDMAIPPYPSTPATLAVFAKRNGCGGALRPTGKKLDLEWGVEGEETRVESYGGCPRGGAADLWVMEGAGHAPWFEWQSAAAIWEWLSAHAR